MRNSHVKIFSSALVNVNRKIPGEQGDRDVLSVKVLTAIDGLLADLV